MQSALELVKTHHADNFGWALACCEWDRHTAEDVLQECYLRVLDGRAVFNEKSSAKTWFFAVIKRVAVSANRKRKRRSAINLRIFSDRTTEHSEHTTVLDTIYSQENAQRLKTALMQLSAKQREVLHLVFYSDLSVEESAMALQISVGSARTHYHRGKTRLVKLLTQEGKDE